MASESGAKASNVRILFWGRRKRGTTAAASLSRSSHNKQWPVKTAQLICHLCSSHSQRKGTECQMWCGSVHGALFHRVSHKSKSVIYHPLWILYVTTKEWCKVPQTSHSSQNYVSNELLYTTFYIIHAIHRPKFIIKMSEHFFPD
jgi:hypothetical protein